MSWNMILHIKRGEANERSAFFFRNTEINVMQMNEQIDFFSTYVLCTSSNFFAP